MEPCWPRSPISRWNFILCPAQGIHVVVAQIWDGLEKGIYLVLVPTYEHFIKINMGIKTFLFTGKSAFTKNLFNFLVLIPDLLYQTLQETLSFDLNCSFGTCLMCFLPAKVIPKGARSDSLLSLHSSPQWKDVWAPCKRAPRWSNSVVAPRGWFASITWMTTGHAFAGDPLGRMRKPKVSVSLRTSSLTPPGGPCPLVNKWERRVWLNGRCCTWL